MKRIVFLILMMVFALVPMRHSFADGPLVSTNWLSERLDDDSIVILDIRSPRSTRDFFAEGHIPGAIAAPYSVGWRTEVDSVIGMLPPIAEITAHIQSLGVKNTSHVVIVPFGNSSTDFGAATRVYWTFKVLGHDKVSILDGGYKAWFAAGNALSTNATQPKRSDFTSAVRKSLVATEGEVQSKLRGGADLIDARPVSQFEGKAKSPVVSKAGTIPGAVNMRQSLFYNTKNASFASGQRIDRIINRGGVSRETPHIVFCNTGHWASLAWFALSEIAGEKNVTLYDGSMTEWTSNEGNPVLSAR